MHGVYTTGIGRQNGCSITMTILLQIHTVQGLMVVLAGILFS